VLELVHITYVHIFAHYFRFRGISENEEYEKTAGKRILRPVQAKAT
jgi:hypothetical protein